MMNFALAIDESPIPLVCACVKFFNTSRGQIKNHATYEAPPETMNWPALDSIIFVFLRMISTKTKYKVIMIVDLGYYSLIPKNSWLNCHY